MNENALRYIAIAGTLSAFGWWLYRRFAGRKVSADSGAYIAGYTLAGDDEIYVGAPELKVKPVGYIEPSPSPLEFVAVTARKIAAVVSAWTASRGEEYRPLFDAAEARYAIPHGLLFRQAYQESRFRQDIIDGTTRSSAGAVGIMQVIPKYHPELGEAGALDPQRAVPYAAKYMAQLFKEFKDWRLALAAYNAGPGNVRKYQGVPPFSETQNYVAQITADVPVGVA